MPRTRSQGLGEDEPGASSSGAVQQERVGAIPPRVFENPPQSPSLATAAPVESEVVPRDVRVVSAATDSAAPTHPARQSSVREPRAPSSHGRRSRTAIAAARARLEYDTSVELLELEERQIQMRKAHIKKKFEASLAQLEADSERSSEPDLDNTVKVREWLDTTQDTRRNVGAPPAPQPPREPRTVRGEEGAPVTRKLGIDRAVWRRAQRPGTPSPPRVGYRDRTPSPPVHRDRYRTASPHEERRRRTSVTPPPRRRRADDLAESIVGLSISRPPPRLPQELPKFSGAYHEWLWFKKSFEDTTTMFKFTEAENLARLRVSLVGDARDAVIGLLQSTIDTNEIMETLEQCFGDPELIVERTLDEIRQMPRLTGSAVQFSKFAIKLKNVVVILKSLDQRQAYLSYPPLIREVVEKLESHMQTRWYEYAEMHLGPGEPELVLLSRFLMNEGRRTTKYSHANAKEAPRVNKEASRVNKEVVRPRPPVRPKRVESKHVFNIESKVCSCCGGSHEAALCGKLMDMGLNERWAWCKQARVCFKCLKGTHRRSRCTAGPCGIDGCTRPHHRLLHSVARDDPTPAPPVTRGNNTETVLNASVAASERRRDLVLLKVCPVKLEGPNGRAVDTFALLDEGSTVTLLDASLADQIQARGPTRGLRIQALGASQDEHDSREVTIRISGKASQERHTITARTVRGLALSRQTIDASSLDFGHLRGIDRAHLCYDDAEPRILIGADNWHLIVTRQLLAGGRREPVASLTSLGWTVHGTVPRAVIASDDETVLHVHTRDYYAERERAKLNELHSEVKWHFEVESLGVSKIVKPSQSEQRALDIFARTARRVEFHFEVGLPWKEDAVTMPPSYQMAFKRLRSIEKKMDESPEFATEYTAQIDNLLAKGYAEPCQGRECDSPIAWYLPHFAVRNANKPGKVRLVHDAAATVGGVSLNDKLLDGPDLLRSLPGVLFKFRERAIAVTADIREMFMRIKIRKKDQPAQLFLWRGNNRTDPPNQYKMTSMIFGARSSPFLAHSVRDLNAREHKDLFPMAYAAITSNHYMDDWVDSFETEDLAARAVGEVVTVHARAGFQLAGWSSNSERALEFIPPELGASAPKRLGQNGPDMAGKTLGMMWEPNKDTLYFNTAMHKVPREVRELVRRPTKREALSAVMSIFDPLGLLSFYTIRAKIILQSIWRIQIGWDDELPETEAGEYLTWLRDVEMVKNLRLERFVGFNRCTIDVQLHVFNDASEIAYATAAYWRLKYSDGSIRVALVAAKARVAPIRAPSIPRLELQANLLGARLAATIASEHRVDIHKTVLWSDSRTALHWIRNDKPRYTPFVAHRLAEISELTKTSQWRWVPTADNVADDATRPRLVEVKSDDRWFEGPAFLYREERDWPVEPEVPTESDDEVVVTHVSVKADPGHLPEIDRFSNYDRLIRTTARVIAFVDILRKRSNCLGLGHIAEAERLWIVKAQQDDFETEIACIRKGEALPRTSRLYKLDPRLDADGILRMRGRINAARIGNIDKEPAILDSRNAFTRLLIAKVHRRAGHAGNERVINDVRQRFHVLKLRSAVRAIGRACNLCRLKKATPYVPAFGDLPAARLDAYSPPFTNCGLDYFGPMTVTIGRRHEKRWGALFTCLTTRAVHLELASSLSTDSAIMALRRMAARRGWPRVIFSDNGTNFRGADAELRAAMREWQDDLKEFALTQGVEWRFIDPGAPNQGGAWERLVRSVKSALSITLKERAPKEEVLRTLLAEAEFTINGRPLTHVATEPGEPEALTPNHFLIGRANGLPVNGRCEEADRRQWRAAQALADCFWRRWVDEYLPQLIPRGSPTDARNNLEVGDLVVVVDSSLPRNVWPRGEVVATYPGPDGTVRSVDVRTKGGIFRRPVRRLAVLPK